MRLSPAIAAALTATSLGSLISLIDPPAANAYRIMGWDSRYRRGDRLHNIGVDMRYYANPINRTTSYYNSCANIQPGTWREDRCRARYAPAPQSVEPYQPIPRPVYYAAPVYPSAPVYQAAPVQVIRVVPTVAPAPVVRTSYTQPIPAYRATGSQTAGRGIWGFFE